MSDIVHATADFKYREFAASSAPAAVRESIKLLCVNVLQPLRDAIGKEVIVTSGYRPQDSDSDHRLGQAADIKVECMSSQVLAAFLATVLPRRQMDPATPPPYDQLIWYDAPDTHVHVGWRGPRNRGMILHAVKPPSGKTQYLWEKP